MPDGWEQVRSLVREKGRELVLVVNHSGGKDSMRMLGLLRDRFPEVATVCVMADTGFEHRRAPSRQGIGVRERCAQLALPVPLTVVRNASKTYLEMVEQRGMFPSAQFRQCTSDLKRAPIERFIRSLPNQLVINCMGIRAQESTSRSRVDPWSANTSLTTRTRTVFNWFPIFRETQTQVLEWHWNTGTPLHPVYVPEFHRDGTTGEYLRRLSCRVCIFSTDRDLVAIAKHDPEAFAQISELEQRLGFTMKPTGSLVQIVQRREAELEEHARQDVLCFPS